MEIYLPVAEMSVNWLVIIALGMGVGFLSGMFGVGGGFLMTPLLVFAGIPSTVAVATTLSHITASSMSGALSQWRRQGIDFVMAGVMLGGLLQLGIQVPALLRLGLLPRIGVRWSAIRAAWADPTTRKVARLMLPALLGVSVAQVSLLINTQIASHLATGSVSWITYADRLMELPTALLGVALGVVLMGDGAPIVLC